MPFIHIYCCMRIRATPPPPPSPPPGLASTMLGRIDPRTDPLSMISTHRHFLKFLGRSNNLLAMLQIFILLLLVALAQFPQLSDADWARNALYHFRDRARPEPKAVALTFDDGPHQMLTPQLLDVLKEKNAKATFYVMGIKTQLHPDIVSRAHKEGHEIANHVWDHPVLSKLKYEEVQSQLSKTTLEIEKAMGDVPKTMRPPYGNTNPRLNNYITQSSNLTVVIWSLDTLDWKRPAPEEIIKKVAENIKAGDIILCHDIHPSTIAAMPGLIDAVRAKGFEFLTVSQLMASEYAAKVTVPDRSQQKVGNLRGLS